MRREKEHLLLIQEDAESTKAQIFNNLIKQKLGFNIFKNKNKPENEQSISELRNTYQPTINRLENIVRTLNPRDKNLIDLIDLVRLVVSSNTPINIVEDDYRQYVSIPPENSNFLKTSKTYLEFSEKVHSLVKSQDEEKNIGTSDDVNKKYEDEDIIVFLANTGDPATSLKNCEFYGKGSSLCISGSSSSHYYNLYRWENDMTTYFIWLKAEQRYILIDAMDNNGSIKYSYNNVKTVSGDDDNHDYKTTKEELLNLYPVLEKAFQNNVFVPVPIEGDEKNFYENIYSKTSILDVETLQNKIMFATLKRVNNNDLYELNDEELKSVLKVLVEKNTSLPSDLLEKFPSLQKRYWEKKKIILRRRLHNFNNDYFNIADAALYGVYDNGTFNKDEYYLMWTDEEFNNLAKQKIPSFNEFLKYYEELRKATRLNSLSLSSPFPVELPLLEEVNENIHIRSVFGEISLPKLKKAVSINCYYSEKLNIPVLEEIGFIQGDFLREINCPSLKRVETTLHLPNVLKFDFPNLENVGYLFLSKVKDVHLPKLMSSTTTSFTNLNIPNAKTINLPKIENVRLDIHNCEDLDAPLLRELKIVDISGVKELYLPNLTSMTLTDSNANISAEKVVLPKLKLMNELCIFENVKVLEMPLLEKIESMIIYSKNLKKLKLDSLKTGHTISANSVEVIDLPKLEKITYIDGASAKIVNLPELKGRWSDISLDFKQLEKIIIDKDLLGPSILIKKDVKIIEPFRFFDESSSFKKFFYIRNI